MIVGDLNINLLDTNNSNSKKLLNIMNGYELAHLNKNVATRVTDQSQTLIDHFFCSIQCPSTFKTVDVQFSAVHAKLTVKVENLKDALIKNTSAIKYPRTVFRFQVLNLIPKSRLVPTDRDLIPAA
jgi:hypothetical protein